MKVKNYSIHPSVYFIVAALLIAYFFPREGKFRYQFYEGKPWRYGLLTAPSDFPIYKTDDQKRELVKNVYKATCDAVGELPKNKCIVIFKEHADNNVGVDGVLRVDAKKNGTFHV